MNLLKNVTNLIFKEKFALILTVVFVFISIALWGRLGDPVIDCGREAYIPYSMAFLGKVLYKDIICIYGPVPYYLNAVIVRLFGPSLNLFYTIGTILSYILILTFYNILKRFTGGLCALLVSVFVLVLCVFSPLIQNYIFPYSYASVYGVVFAVLHLYFLLKFIDEKSPKYLYFAAFFMALTVLSKFDFAVSTLVIAFLSAYYLKNLGLKRFFNVFLCFLAPFICVLAIFLIQKVSIGDILFNFKAIFNMAKAPSLLYFYENFTGYFFDIKKTFRFIAPFSLSFIVMALVFTLSFYIGKIKNKFLSFALMVFQFLVSACFLILISPEYLFYYFPLIIFLYLSFRVVFAPYRLSDKGFQPISDDTIKFYTIIIFSLLISLKALFGLSLSFYGIYYLPFILISALLILSKISKILVGRGVSAVSISLIGVFLFFNLSAFLGLKTFKINTPSGFIYASPHLARPMSEAIDFLNKNLEPKDSLLVLPEGLFVNFVLKKDYPLFNTSFTPLDFDAYGENYLIDSVLAYSPKYILILPRKFDDYGKGLFCSGFGQEFCSKIAERYVLKHSFPKNPDNSRAFLNLLERKK